MWNIQRVDIRIDIPGAKDKWIMTSEYEILVLSKDVLEALWNLLYNIMNILKDNGE